VAGRRTFRILTSSQQSGFQIKKKKYNKYTKDKKIHTRQIQKIKKKMGTGFLFQGVKWWECEVDHSQSSSAEFKNEWSYTSIPLFLHGLEWGNFASYINRSKLIWIIEPIQT
jgi:hypothetical protein